MKCIELPTASAHILNYFICFYNYNDIIFLLRIELILFDYICGDSWKAAMM